MELIKWQSVIVEWVNCLNLSKPVQTIGDLKNEDFFRKLLLFLTPPDQITSLDRSVEDISLTEFLKKHYPSYSLEVEPTLIQDDIEICNICSLLLHYCCFTDGRQELIVPLYKELNTVYQFHIKSFLEDLQESPSITRDLLSDAITNRNKYSTPTKFAKTPFDSPKLVRNTPLVDFLKTPLKKQQVYDSYKKEIKHLQAQLDLERFEKADLQEEINLQYEKNKKFDKIISNKQSEISRLRSELLALESRTPPANTKTDGRLENKRLRDEISSLEKYVEILHKEQEEIQTERDKAREKLRKVEETCNDWQSRALNSERQCSNISEENEYQRGELIQLREKCEELSSILKEMNAKNVCDESYEIDHMQAEFLHNRSGSIDYESLAHTVVDVQLIDAQEENKDLRKQLGELEVNTTELSTQMNQLQSEITKMMDENKMLVDSNKNLLQKISDTEKQFEKCQETIKLTHDENTNLNTLIIELKKKLLETEFNLAYYENESKSLSNNLKSTIEINNNLNEQLSDKIKDFNHLLSQKSKLHSKLDEATQKVLKSESENAIFKEFCDKFNVVLENYVIKFDTDLKEYSESSTGNDNILKLQNLITILEQKIQNETKNCNLLSNQNYCLQDKLSSLSSENELLKDFLEKFNQVFESCMMKFEEELKQYVAEPSTGNDNISKLRDLVIFLENKIKTDAQNFKLLQENSNSLLSRITNLQDEVSTLYNNEIDSQKEKHNLQICLEDSKSKIQQLDEEINNNNTLISICKSTIEEKSTEISSLKDVLISKDNFIEGLNKEKCYLTSNLQAVKKKLAEETHALDLADKKINMLVMTLQEAETKLIHLEEDIVTYKSTIEEKTSEISSLKNVLLNNDKIIKDLNKEICDIKSDLLEVKQLKDIANNEIVNLKTVLQLSEVNILELENYIEEKSKEICELNHIVTLKERNMEHLNIEKNNLIIRLESSESIFSKEKNAKEEAETEIENLNSSLQNYVSKIQDFTVIIDNNKKLIESYKSIIEEKSKEFNDVVTIKDKLITDIENEKYCLSNTLKTVENKLLKEKQNTELAQTEIINLKSKLQEVELKLKDNNKLIETYKKDIEDINIQLTDVKEDLDKKKSNLATTLQTVENKLFEEKRAKELVEKDCQKMKDHLTERENCIKSLEIQKTELENNVDFLNKEIFNQKNSKIIIEEKCIELQTIITDVEQQMQVLNKDKMKLNHQLENVKEELDNIKTNNEDLTKSISDKDNQLQNLEKQKQNLNAKKEKLEKELKNAEDSTEVLKSKLEEMTTSVDEKTNHICKLELEKTDLQNHIVNLEKEFSKITKQKDVLVIELKDITKSLNQKEISIKSLENDKNTILQQFELLNKNLTSQELELSNKITDHLNRNHQLQSEIDTLNQNFSMINIEVSTIVNMLKSEEDIYLELEQIHTGDSFGKLSKTISNLKNNICNLIFEKRRLDSETTILQQQISDLEHLKSSVEESHVKITSESTKKINDLTEDKEKYKLNMETYRKKLDEVQKDLEKTESNAEKLILEHVQVTTEYQINITKLQEQIIDLEEKNRQFKHRETNMTTDLLSVKTELKETIINYQRTLESLENMKLKNLQLSEEKTMLALKLDQVTDDCTQLKSSLEDYSSKHSQKLQEIEEVRINLNSHEKIVQKLEEEITAKDDLVTEQDKKINELNSKLTEFVQEVKILNDEKSKYVSQLSELSSILNHLEESRKEISEEMKQKILDAEETMDKMKVDFNNKIKVIDKERFNELEIKKQLENNVESLTKQLADSSSDTKKLISLCKESNNKIHSLYTIVFENEEDKQIIEQIRNLKQQEKQLESLSDEKEIVGKEFDFIANEIILLKKSFKELSNYETLKSDYEDLKNKCHILSICEIENNTLKNKLSDLQFENTKYQKKISEKEVDHKSTKGKYEEEIDLMKASCENWQKIINENEAEHKKLQNDHLNLKEKYDTEYEVLKKSNTKLKETVFELEQQIKYNSNIIFEHETKYQDLNDKYETASQKISTLDPEILNLQDKINNYKKIITDLESDNIKLSKNFNDLSEQHKTFMEKCRQNHTQTDKDEIAKLRSAYSDLMTENSRLQLDCTVLKKTVEDRNNQLSNLTLIKDAYEKLLEENNKVNMELDTLRYKRTRDKEEFKRVFEESNAKSDHQIQEVRSEYEEKLKKMKEKIVKLYREEVEKEKKKVCTVQQGQAEETISTLKSQLWVTGNKYVDLKKENEQLREQLLKVKDHHQLEILEITRGSDTYGSRDSLCSLRERRPIREIEERRTSTLPRDMKSSYTPHSQQIDIIEESVTISRKRRSITAVPKNLDPGLKMEDEEGEFFNNTYLADLKAGRCIVSDRDSICSTSSRLSELQFRNSLCPPHLKSSYPAETQFASPGQCKEEDIKMGAVDLDDSMSSSLLPGEKPRTKKDWGQTLYKKPGPPTPSKNGGRLSLQGNEVHPREVLREHNPGRTTSTPSRIKALFTRSGTSSRDTENVSTPRGPTKRRSIFRR